MRIGIVKLIKLYINYFILGMDKRKDRNLYLIIILGWYDPKIQEPIWYINLNTCFQFLNNIICIFIHFFTHTYFQKNLKIVV